MKQSTKCRDIHILVKPKTVKPHSLLLPIGILKGNRMHNIKYVNKKRKWVAKNHLSKTKSKLFKG
jgi:hypothetical protein